MDRLNRNLPPLRALLVLEAVARTGSFTRAAAELSVSQPAVSRQIRGLEEYLGVRLFHRRHRSVELTAAGREYRDGITSAFEQIVAVGEQIARDRERRRVTVRANYGLASYWLLPRVVELSKAHPDLDVMVQTVEGEPELEPGEAELAIRFGDGHWNDGKATLLFEEEVFPICSQAYLEQGPAMDSVEDLHQHTLLHVKQRGDRWLGWIDVLTPNNTGDAGTPGLRLNNYTLVLEAALAGHGIALGWAHLVDHLVERGWLVRPIDAVWRSNLGYYAVAGPRARQQPAVALVLDWLTGTNTGH